MVEFCEIDQKEEDNHQEEEDGGDSDNHFSKGSNDEESNALDKMEKIDRNQPHLFLIEVGIRKEAITAAK